MAEDLERGGSASQRLQHDNPLERHYMRDITYKAIPFSGGVVLVFSVGAILVATLTYHRPLPRQATIAVSVTLLVLFVLFLLGVVCLYHEKHHPPRNDPSSTGGKLQGVSKQVRDIRSWLSHLRFRKPQGSYTGSNPNGRTDGQAFSADTLAGRAISPGALRSSMLQGERENEHLSQTPGQRAIPTIRKREPVSTGCDVPSQTTWNVHTPGPLRSDGRLQSVEPSNQTHHAMSDGKGNGHLPQRSSKYSESSMKPSIHHHDLLRRPVSTHNTHYRGRESDGFPMASTLRSETDRRAWPIEADMGLPLTAGRMLIINAVGISEDPGTTSGHIQGLLLTNGRERQIWGSCTRSQIPVARATGRAQKDMYLIPRVRHPHGLSSSSLTWLITMEGSKKHRVRRRSSRQRDKRYMLDGTGPKKGFRLLLKIPT
ncbi:hypothetical protein F4780DRAFT_725762 [Xylariomycetidae sp. FL0641]|nr:hypothetical protein F4780DRAFT_725762 [Xylariomycetidae sp. FL0641]